MNRMIQLPDGSWVTAQAVLCIDLRPFGPGSERRLVTVQVSGAVGVHEQSFAVESEAQAVAQRDRIARAVNGGGDLTREEATELANEICVEAWSNSGNREEARVAVADILMEHFS